VAYAETMATIFRKKRESNLKEDVVRKIVLAFQRDWSGFIHVEVTNDLNEYIYKVLQNHSLRGFDAIHLASALVIYSVSQNNFPIAVVF
jgi:predicted nucleic acid-binding protein